MLNPDLLSHDQQLLIDRLFEHDTTLAIAEMGFGKSVCALSAAAELLNAKHLHKVLIVAPLKPCRSVWAHEHEKWTHLSGLRVNVALGTEAERIKAVEADCDICVINFDNLVWFLNTYKDNHEFDGLIIDELTKLKANSSKSVKKLRYRTNDFKWRVGMSATPVAENLDGLFSQVLCLDGGERFGRSKERFLQSYFYPTDYNQYKWAIRIGGETELLRRIEDIVYNAALYSMDLPELVEKEYRFNMPSDMMDKYKSLKRDSVYTVCDGTDIVADNAAVLSSKLEQFASGFLYGAGDPSDRKVYHLHNYRTFALEEYLALQENQDENILIFYKFIAERDTLIKLLGDDAVLLEEEGAEAQWNAGNIKYLLCHPKSASHGLNLAEGGARVLWYSPEWSNDSVTQANARLHRRGQLRRVIVTSLICADTVNELTVMRIEDKREAEALFKQHLS